MKKNEQLLMFQQKVELIYVESVIGSGYETNVAELALIDKIAYRAARKNMQKHSAIILKLDNEFAGFFTFEVNHKVGEFCLLQSAMYPDKKDKKIYSMMVQKIIDQNTYGYHMVMTVSKKHDLENPKVFTELGFKVNLEKSEFVYMYYGKEEQVRVKRLCHMAMTNLWNSTSGEWLKVKRAWNEQLEESGRKYNIPNPKFASREGCWQGKAGMSNIVLSKQKVENGEIITDATKDLNGNASVLDPTACEIIVRMFMPTNGVRVYNPFGGGVQMGFVAGGCGFEYLSSEIRQNQCDVNNALCQDFYNVKWLKSDTSKFTPKQKYDLIFSCPPYYKVETYLDYDGKAPKGELNSLPTYEEFRDMLFEGYKNAISVMNDNTFFVVMTGDSRNKDGGYNDCYALKTATRYGIDFSKSIERNFENEAHKKSIINQIEKIDMPFIRIGCAGDPSENWQHTINIIKQLKESSQLSLFDISSKKQIVIITRHWNLLTDNQLNDIKKYNICINTSVSALDNENLINIAIKQYNRLKPYCKSVLRVITAEFNLNNQIGIIKNKIQSDLLKNKYVIDTVFRPSSKNKFLVDGIIKAKKMGFMKSKALVSKNNKKTFLGKCNNCIEMCGLNIKK